MLKKTNFKNKILISLLSLIVVCCGSINLYAQSTQIFNIGAVVGAISSSSVTDTGGVITITDKLLKINSSTTDVTSNSSVTKQSSTTDNHQFVNIEESANNPIVVEIRKIVDLMLPRTGGQQSIINISLILILLGLLICIPVFRKKSK